MSPPYRGILIALEGIDGAGKTTQVGALRDILGQAGVPVVVTKEPTSDTEHGRLIRASAASERLPLAEELHAFVEDRRAHVARIIRPALEAGSVVIVDRYYLSTIAYQGARGADVVRVRRLNEAFAPVPDLLVHLDIDAARGMARVRGRGEVSAFEREEELRVAGEIFRTMQGPHVLRLSGELPVEQVTAAIMQRLVAGPLRRMLCADLTGELCDPPWCVTHATGQCPWPTLARAWNATA